MNKPTVSFMGTAVQRAREDGKERFVSVEVIPGNQPQLRK
jgi:hypothetical protein